MPRNIVLVCLDTVRKDYFDEYAPRLRDGADAEFDQCRAASSWTTPSHASLFTGLLPHRHDIHTHDRRFTSLTPADTFLGDLPPEYTTVGISANVHAGPAFGFDGLFDAFTGVTSHNFFPEGMDVKTFLNDCESSGFDMYREFVRTALGHDAPLKTLANGVTVRLAGVTDGLPVPRLVDDGTKRAVRTAYDYLDDDPEPFFMFMNLMDGHPPFQHTRGYDRDLHDVSSSWSTREFDYWEVRDGDVAGNEENVRNFKGLYRAAIDYLDRHVAPFVEQLHRRTGRETTVVVTADHGEDLGGTERDPRFGHVGSLSEGLLHVPLLVFNPPEDVPDVGDDYVTHLDLGDLVTAMADGEVPDLGRDTIPAEVVGGISADHESPLSEAEYRYWNRMIRCVYRDDRKIQWNSLGESTEYRIDKGTPSTQAFVEEGVALPDWATAFFETDIESYKEQARQQELSIDDAVDDTVQDQLRELGYL